MSQFFLTDYKVTFMLLQKQNIKLWEESGNNKSNLLMNAEGSW
jgi:hypothetical protein